MLASVSVAIFALVEFIRAKRLEFEDKRPYVIPQLSTQMVGDERHLHLTLKNVGDTPAKNVRLSVEGDVQWHWVREPNYPFLSSKGISAIGPGEEARFFLGVVRKGNPLEGIDTEEFQGLVHFDNPRGGKTITDKFRVSLNENRYKAR
jgi:hypothetical protein